MSRASRRIAPVLCLLAIVFSALPGHADSAVDPRIRFSIETVTPPLDGLTVTISPPIIAHLPPQVTADNTSNADLVILDDAGAPMLRVGPSGTYLNTSSAAAFDALDPSGLASTHPTVAPTGGAVAWQRFAAGHLLRWYERRAVYPAHGPKDASQPARLQTFRIPARTGSTAVSIDGLISWRPILGSVETRVTGLVPSITGVSVIAQQGPTPALQMTSSSPSLIVLQGRDGRPFAKIGPKGVDVNINSATYRDTKLLPALSSTAKTTKVVWKHQQDTPVLTWLERRAAGHEPPIGVQEARRLVSLGTWSVPGKAGATTFAIRGVVEWRPLAARQQAAPPEEPGSPIPWAAIFGGIIVGTAVVTAATVRRRRG